VAGPVHQLHPGPDWPGRGDDDFAAWPGPNAASAGLQLLGENADISDGLDPAGTNEDCSWQLRPWPGHHRLHSADQSGPCRVRAVLPAAHRPGPGGRGTTTRFPESAGGAPSVLTSNCPTCSRSACQSPANWCRSPTGWDRCRPA